MRIPGFTAQYSTDKSGGHFASPPLRRSHGNATAVYPQKPNSENTPGGKCNASTTAGSGGTINQGTYDSEGRCCGPKLSNGSQYCINCDGSKSTCDDGHKERFSHPFELGHLHSGVFSRM